MEMSWTEKYGISISFSGKYRYVWIFDEEVNAYSVMAALGNGHIECANWLSQYTTPWLKLMKCNIEMCILENRVESVRYMFHHGVKNI